MTILSKKIFIGILTLMLTACQTSTPMTDIPTPAPILPVAHELGIIGAVEPLYFLPMKSPFLARIDTGAENSSIDVRYTRTFERDGEKWVAFDLINLQTGEKQYFEKPIEKHATIIRSTENEKRIVVSMDIKMGDKIITEKFSLANRDKFEYQALIGRNILTGRAVIDTSLSQTLK